jgi:energy-coupling factor transport system permease protein
MSTTDKDRSTTTPAGTPGRPPAGGLRSRALGLAALGVLAGAIVWAVGLPAGPTLFGSSLAELTVPTALLLALGSLWVAGWASTRRPRWRVVDIVVASTIGVAGGFLFVAWNIGWEPLSRALAFFPPASGALVGVWLLPAVLGGLIVRRPGAAVYTELVAATVSALVGNQWGFATVWYGLLEGMGAEVVLALLLYRRWGIGAALAAGAGAGLVVGLLDSFVYYPDFPAAYKAAYVVLTVLSGIVLAGLGAWALTRALRATGALAPLASGRDAARV